MSAEALGSDGRPARRPGTLSRLLRGFASGAAPTVLAVHAAGLAWSTRGLPERGHLLASLVFAGTWIGVFLARRAVRRTRAGRVVWSLALVAWIVVAAGRSYAAWPSRDPGPVLSPRVAAWPAGRQPFLAGVGDGSFRVEASDPIAGYGGGPRREAFPWLAPGPLALLSRDWMANRVLGGDGVRLLVTGTPARDDLGARALVLRPAGAGFPLAIVRLDLVICDRRLRPAVLARVADLGFTEPGLVLCATHTHSGPGGFSSTCLAELVATDLHRPESFERVVAATVAAIRAAHAAARPARIGVVRAKDEGDDGRPILARNRSAADEDFVDREILALRFDAAEGGGRIALLLNPAVHPVWGRPRDREFSRDLAGALEDAAGIGDGAPVLFVNGAEGDVRPRLKRAALPAFAARIAPALAPRASSATLRVVAASVERDLGSPRFVDAFVGGRERVAIQAERPFGRGGGGIAGGLLAAPANVLLAAIGAPDLHVVVSVGGGLGIVVGLERTLSSTVFPFGAWRLETENGDVLLGTVPAEPNTAVGFALKAAGRARGAVATFVFGLANDHAAYLATSGEYVVDTYEARMTLFGAGAAAASRGAVEAAFDATAR
jgi:hypothetical protein